MEEVGKGQREGVWRHVSMLGNSKHKQVFWTRLRDTFFEIDCGSTFLVIYSEFNINLKIKIN